MYQLLERRQVVLGGRWPGHFQMRGTVGRGFLWGWSAEDLRQGERVVVKRGQVGDAQGRETVECLRRLGQLRQLGEVGLAELLAVQFAAAHLGQVRQVRQGSVAGACWWARRVAPGRGDPGWYRGHAPG